MVTPIHALFVDRGLVFYGGVSQVILNLSKFIDNSNVEMHFTSLKQQDTTMVDALLKNKVHVHNCVGDGYLIPAKRLRQLVIDNKIDIIIANCFRSFLISKLSTLGTKIKIIYWIHDISAVATTQNKLKIFHRMTRRTTLLFISKAVQKAYYSSKHQGREYIVYNGVDQPKIESDNQLYDRAMRHDFGFSHEDIVIVCTAGFSPRKNQRLLIEAFDLLFASRNNIHLMLIGTGELLDAARELANSLPSSQHIHFLGPRPDARRLLGLADLCVQPAYAEAFGLTVVEAMLAKLPVLVSDDAAFPELIEHGRTGLLFKSNDRDELLKQLTFMLEHPVQARQMGQQAYEYARKHFSPERFALQVEQVLEIEAVGAYNALSLESEHIQ